MDWFLCEVCGNERRRETVVCGECGIDGVADADLASRLIEALDGGRSVRRNAERAIRSITDPRSLPVLEQYLRDGGLHVDVVADALGTLSSLSSYELMCALPTAHGAKVRYLARLGTDAARDRLFELCQDDLNSVLALASTGDLRAIAPFFKIIDSTLQTPFALTAMNLSPSLSDWLLMTHVKCDELIDGVHSRAEWLLDVDERVAEHLVERDSEWIERRKEELEREKATPLADDVLAYIGDDAAMVEQIAKTVERLQDHKAIELDPEHWRQRAFASVWSKFRPVYGLLAELDTDRGQSIRKRAVEVGLLYGSAGSGVPVGQAGGRLLFPIAAPDTREPISRFGAQPTWIDDPMWPLGLNGEPMSFWAQFQLPWQPEALAYLFLDRSSDGMGWSKDGSAALFVQRGGRPQVDWAAQAEGPIIPISVLADDGFRAPMHHKVWPAVPSLEPVVDGDDDHRRLLNRLGGKPVWSQGDETPGPGWRFLFQFSAGLLGPELADGADCYGFVHEDGRGSFLWQCG